MKTSGNFEALSQRRSQRQSVRLGEFAFLKGLHDDGRRVSCLKAKQPQVVFVKVSYSVLSLVFALVGKGSTGGPGCRTHCPEVQYLDMLTILRGINLTTPCVERLYDLPLKQVV